MWHYISYEYATGSN